LTNFVNFNIFKKIRVCKLVKSNFQKKIISINPNATSRERKMNLKNRLSTITLIFLIFLEIFATVNPAMVKASSTDETQVVVSGATASSYYGTLTPNQAIDGIESNSNFWGTNGVVTTGQLPQWLQLDLGTTQTNVNQVVTHFYNGDTRTYTYYIQVSTDGSSWTTVVSTKTGSSIMTDTFTSITARYVRLTVTGNTANNAAQIEEIKIYKTTSSTTQPNSFKYMGAMNPDWCQFIASDVASMKNSGANTLKAFLYLDYWNSNGLSHVDGKTTYQAGYIQMAQWVHTNGMKFWMECFSSNWNPPEGWYQMKANVILNYNGMGDQWINGFGQIIQTLHPDVVDVMNEPPYFAIGTTYASQYTNAQFFQAYEQFVLRAIDAWRAIDPNLVISVAPMPFWDFSSMAANPISRSNIIYDYHFSYCGDNIAPAPSAPDQYAYWTGQLSTAKSTLYTDFLSWSGIQLMLNKGLSIEFGETGTNLANPNAQQFMQDVYDFGDTYNIGIIQDTYRPYNPISTAGMGILNSDYHTLNWMGQLWATNMKRG
jgi:hypothetical protein